MSELRHRYDRAAVSDRITQPPFTDLVDRGRRRAHRTRAVRLAGVTVLAALVAAPLLTLPGEDQSGAPAESPPRTWEAYEITALFYDPHFGVASYDGDACGEGWFSVTQDGGMTWSELRELPRLPDQQRPVDVDGEPVCGLAMTYPIGPDTLLMPGSLPRSVLPDPLPSYMRADAPSFISHDAGRTWREYEPQLGTADSVPDGVSPSWPCDEEQCKEAGLGWYDPQTGDWIVLENQPQGVEYDGVNVGLDGSIWVSGIGDGPDGEFRLSVSWDRGRTWQDRTPDEDVGLGPILRTIGGNTAYVYSSGNDPSTDSFELYRTIDGGETWHQLPAAEQFEGVVGVWMNRDGGLVLDTVYDQRPGVAYLSTDGGETFTSTELPVWLSTELPGGGFEASPHGRPGADPIDLYLSEDGRTWRPVEVPYLPVPGDPATGPSE